MAPFQSGVGTYSEELRDRVLKEAKATLVYGCVCRCRFDGSVRKGVVVAVCECQVRVNFSTITTTGLVIAIRKVVEESPLE